MFNPTEMDKSDKYTIAGLLASLALWWLFVGRGKYGKKGRVNYGR